jgi:hypothetical protein
LNSPKRINERIEDWKAGKIANLPILPPSLFGVYPGWRGFLDASLQKTYVSHSDAANLRYWVKR